MARKYILIKFDLWGILSRPRVISLKGYTGNAYISFDNNGASDKKSRLVHVVNDLNFDHFSVEIDGSIKCIESNKRSQYYDDHGNYKEPEKRIIIKPGKFLEVIRCGLSIKASNDFNENITRETWENRWIELFTADCKAAFTPIEPKLSDKPSTIYTLPTSQKAGNTLSNSCMRHESTHGKCKTFSGFYDGMCDILYDVDEKGHLLYRALLWKLHNTSVDNALAPDSPMITFLDRVYGDELIETRMHEFAKQNGWAYRRFSSSTIIYEGKFLSRGVSAQIPEHAMEFGIKQGTPYCDTINCVVKKTRVIGNNCSNQHKYYILNSSDGNVLKNAFDYKCRHCEKGSDEKSDFVEPKSGGYVCLNCLITYMYKPCNHCGRYHKKSDSYLTKDGQFFCSNSCRSNSNYFECRHCGQYHLDTDLKLSKLATGTMLKICNYCLQTHYLPCEFCNTIELISSTKKVSLESGENITLCGKCCSKVINCKTCNTLLSKANHVKVGQFDYCRTHSYAAMELYNDINPLLDI